MREKRLFEVDELLLFAMDEKGHAVHLSDAGLDELSPGDSEAFVVPDLSEAMGKHPKVFPRHHRSMIRAGETGGMLGGVLERLADYLESQVRMRNKVSSILIYPSVMFAFAMLVVGVLVTVVLPQITELLTSLNQELPFYTRWIIALSNFARYWWWARMTARWRRRANIFCWRSRSTCLRWWST